MQHFAGESQATVQLQIKIASNSLISSSVFSSYLCGSVTLGHRSNRYVESFYTRRRKGDPVGAGKPWWPCKVLLHRWQSADVTCPVVIVLTLGGMRNKITNNAIWKSCSGKGNVILKKLQRRKKTKHIQIGTTSDLVTSLIRTFAGMSSRASAYCGELTHCSSVIEPQDNFLWKGPPPSPRPWSKQGQPQS